MGLDEFWQLNDKAMAESPRPFIQDQSSFQNIMLNFPNFIKLSQNA